MRVEDIEYVIAVARAGGIGKASQQLGMSQPALSKALTRIEADLKTQLFERTAKGVTLSMAGRVFIEYAQRVAMHAADAMVALRELRQGASGLVKIGIGVGVPSDLVSDSLKETLKDGSVRFVMEGGMTDSLLAGLKTGDLDLILCGMPDPEDPDLQWIPLWPDPMVPFLPKQHELAQSSELWSLDNFRKQHWILPPHGTNARGKFDSAFVSKGLAPPEPLIESRTSGMEAQLARDLGALVLMPLCRSKDARVSETFICVQSISSLILERTIAMVSRRGGQRPKLVERFMDRIKADRTSAARKLWSNGPQ